MFTLVSNPDSKTRPSSEPFAVAKPMLWLSIVLYLIAFALPVGSGNSGQSGFLVFAYGPFLCLQAPWLWPAWLANGVYWIALIVAARQRWQLATCVGATASIMAFSVLLVGGLSYRELSAWDLGYWSWSGSMVLLTCAALLVAASPEKKGHRTN